MHLRTGVGPGPAFRAGGFLGSEPARSRRRAREWRTRRLGCGSGCGCECVNRTGRDRTPKSTTLSRRRRRRAKRRQSRRRIAFAPTDLSSDITSSQRTVAAATTSGGILGWRSEGVGGVVDVVGWKVGGGGSRLGGGKFEGPTKGSRRMERCAGAHLQFRRGNWLGLNSPLGAVTSLQRSPSAAAGE
jgi:hypothetical protein